MTPCPQPGDRTQGRRCLSQSPPPPIAFPDAVQPPRSRVLWSPAPAAQQGGAASVPEPLPMAYPAAEQEFHQFSHPLLAPNPLPEPMRWPRHAAPHPMPSSCHRNSHTVTHRGAQGFLYVQLQPPQHVQHSSRLMQEAVRPHHLPDVQGGTPSPQLQASGRGVSWGRMAPSVPAPGSVGSSGSVLRLWWEQSLQEREQVCGEVLGGAEGG